MVAGFNFFRKVVIAYESSLRSVALPLELATHPIKLEQNQKRLARRSALEKLLNQLDLNPELKLCKKVLKLDLSTAGL